MPTRKSSDSRPQITEVFPAAAIPGGEFQLRGNSLTSDAPPVACFGDVPARVVIGSESFMIVRVPEGASRGELTLGLERARGTVAPATGDSYDWQCDIGVQIADGIHPVANPVVDAIGNIYTTLSGTAGQRTPVSVYKLDTNLQLKPFVSDILNATGLALDPTGVLYVSSRRDGIVYQISATGTATSFVEGMGVATGIVFDQAGNLYVGDRSGTIFKISPDRQIYVFATLEPSMAAYHLAFSPDNYLYVTGPTTSSFDVVRRISPDGQVDVFYRGLGRPQGLTFDTAGNLYVSSSLAGRRGVARITPDGKAELFLSGPSIVGVAFASPRTFVVATNSALYRVQLREHLTTKPK
ncbi:MAG: gluconolaconase [Acidobacteriota bacterium]